MAVEDSEATDSDGDGDRIPIEEWDRIVAALAEFGAPRVRTTDEEIRLEFDRAHLAVGRDGAVDAGMPLHATETTAEWLEIDPATDALTLGAPGLSYTFRRP